MSDPLPQAPSRPVRAAWWKRCLFQLVALPVMFCLLLGIAVRFTVRDTVRYCSTIFYATPLPLLAMASGTLLWLDWKRERWGRCIVWGVCLGIFGTWTYQQDWRWTSHTPTSAPVIQALFWNVARQDDLTPVVEYLRESQPDVIGLVEVIGDHRERRAFFTEQMPGYNVTVVGGLMYVLTKGTTGESVPTRLDANSHLRQLPMTVNGVDLEFFIVDIGPHLFRLRGPAINLLLEHLDKVQDRPVLLMGDFNTPPDSAFMRQLRKNYRMAFDVAGRGWAPTWPMVFPVLQLDQIWMNSHLDAVRCTLGWSISSDHRPVHATLQPKVSH